MTTRADVVRAAKTWIGTPYAHQGRLKFVGVDCVGLPICVCKELGLVEPTFDINGYTKDPDGSLMPLAKKYLNQIPIKNAVAGDIVVIGMRGDPRHFCILCDYRHGGLAIIHAYGNAVIETRLLQTTAFKVVAAFSIHGIEE